MLNTRLKNIALYSSAAVVLAVLQSGTAVARDQVQIVGSSTVYPFSTIVAEHFGNRSKFKTPVVESTGTGGGMKLLALYQPVAGDLRFIVAALKINTDLERIGDHASNIAEDVIYLLSGDIIRHGENVTMKSRG